MVGAAEGQLNSHIVSFGPRPAVAGIRGSVGLTSFPAPLEHKNDSVSVIDSSARDIPAVGSR